MNKKLYLTMMQYNNTAFFDFHFIFMYNTLLLREKNMIDVIGDYKEVSHSKEELIELTKTALFEAIHSYGNFMSLIGLQPELFSHLLDIKIKIDYTDEYDELEEVAHYVSTDDGNENSIHILPEYLDEMLTNIETRDIAEYGKWIDDITRTIVHEVMHANRDVILKDRSSVFDTLASSRARLQSKENKSIKEELDYILENKKNLDNSNITLLKVIDKKSYYVCYVYNDRNKTYEMYILSSSIFSSEKDKFKSIESNLRYKDSLRTLKPTKTIPACPDDGFFAGYSDFSYLSNSEVDKLSNEEMNTFNLAVTDQVGLEEAITEAFSILMVAHKNSHSLKIHDVASSIIKNDKMPDDLKIAFEMIENMSPDDIRWFFLSAYLEDYSNRFADMFKEDYPTIISNVCSLYNMSVEDRKDENLYQETRNILKRRIK